MKYFLILLCTSFCTFSLFSELTTDERQALDNLSIEYAEALNDAKSLYAVEHAKWINYYSQERLDNVINALFDVFETLQNEQESKLYSFVLKYPEEEISQLILEDLEKRKNVDRRQLIEGALFVLLGLAPNVSEHELKLWQEMLIKDKLFKRYGQLGFEEEEDFEEIVAEYLLKQSFENFITSADPLIMTLFSEYPEDWEYVDLLDALNPKDAFFAEGLLEELSSREIAPRTVAEVEFVDLHNRFIMKVGSLMFKFIEETGMPLL